jgi:hypothetical protein
MRKDLNITPDDPAELRAVKQLSNRLCRLAPSSVADLAPACYGD